jgi:hypothetical protein
VLWKGCRTAQLQTLCTQSACALLALLLSSRSLPAAWWHNVWSFEFQSTRHLDWNLSHIYFNKISFSSIQKYLWGQSLKLKLYLLSVLGIIMSLLLCNKIKFLFKTDRKNTILNKIVNVGVQVWDCFILSGMQALWGQILFCLL